MKTEFKSLMHYVTMFFPKKLVAEFLAIFSTWKKHERKGIVEDQGSSSL